MKVHVASEKPMSTPSEHQLRYLLFCEGSDDTLDCCEHSKRHRLCHMNGLALEQAEDEYSNSREQQRSKIVMKKLEEL